MVVYIGKVIRLIVIPLICMSTIIPLLATQIPKKDNGIVVIRVHGLSEQIISISKKE